MAYFCIYRTLFVCVSDSSNHTSSLIAVLPNFSNWEEWNHFHWMWPTVICYSWLCNCKLQIANWKSKIFWRSFETALIVCVRFESWQVSVFGHCALIYVQSTEIYSVSYGVWHRTHESTERTRSNPTRWDFDFKRNKDEVDRNGLMEVLVITEIISFLHREESMSRPREITQSAFKMYLHFFFLLYMIQEGIFRKTGSLKRQMELKTSLNKSDPVNFDSYSIHDCACVLKNLIAELPEPLVTDVYYPLCHQISSTYNLFTNIRSTKTFGWA